ncbi:uncharacterized protein LOC115961961 [Quercus lobata]|uniref:uncharacterized protein LOC115961961 n=1 Tax=Quercus lobata TaxID=97700 RepID=UPI001244D54B|nr:uncharacterized protein LOC115961961 [Quercus lobata]
MEATGIRNTDTIFGLKQKLEVQPQLKRLNKPALKSIKSPDGDIIDCVHIKNQPAFDHPWLKNHTIQMRPGSHPKGLSFDESNNVSSNSKPEITQLWHLNGRCPGGTIRIRRTKEEDLLRVSSAANYGRKKHYTTLNVDEGDLHEYALVYERGDKYYGAQATMNVWNPQTQIRNEFTLSQFWITGGGFGNINTIEAGMMVNPVLYGDNKTRIFTFWTTDSYKKTGCYNLLCPGFVQVDNQIALGACLSHISIYGGNQYELNFNVWKDDKDGNWWLQLRGTSNYQLGYWPSSLFTILSDSASEIQWGGEVINTHQDGKHTTTQMGSGHFPEEGFGKASYFKFLKVNDGTKALRDPKDTGIIITQPNCYDILNSGSSFYYGGPGRDPKCP